MSCGCKSSGNSNHSCGSKSANGCPSVDTCSNSYKLSVFDWLSTIEQPSRNRMNDVVEVRFKNDRKSFYKNPNNLPLHIGSIVIVESSPGHDVGVVSAGLLRDSALLDRTLAPLFSPGMLNPQALVVIERSKRCPPPAWPGGLDDCWHRDYGETSLYFAATKPAGES